VIRSDARASSSRYGTQEHFVSAFSRKEKKKVINKKKERKNQNAV
jgi:hypothetical protein